MVTIYASLGEDALVHSLNEVIFLEHLEGSHGSKLIPALKNFGARFIVCVTSCGRQRSRRSSATKSR